MNNKDVQEKFRPLHIRLFILLAVYFIFILPLSAYILKYYPLKIGEFPSLLVINILFTVPLIVLFVNPSKFLNITVSFLRILCRGIDTMNEWVGRGVAWVTFLVVVVVFTDVVMRYAFNTSFVFIQELEWHLFAFIFLMGAGYTLLKDGHVRVDIIYQRLSPKAQAWVNFIGVLFFLLPGCYMVIATSLNFVYTSWTVLEGSPDPGGIPYRFLIKATVPAGFILITLQGISMGIKSFFTIIGKDFEKKPETDDCSIEEIEI